MVKFYPSIPDDLREWMLTQHVFFTASAPLTGRHINVSPKGHPSETFAILNPNQVAYLDATGSGSETISHIYEHGNGRVTLLFTSFDAAPRILRCFCRGKVVERDDAAFPEWIKRMRAAGLETPPGAKEEEGQVGLRQGDEGWLKGIRAAVILDVFKVQTSCGFGVPLLGSEAYSPESTADVEPETHRLQKEGWNDRPTMPRWAIKQAAKRGLEPYRRGNNWRSLDGLPGLKAARRDRGQWLWFDDGKAWATGRAQQWESVLCGVVIAVIVIALLNRIGLLQMEWVS
ncbi:hypothetical protein B0A49_10082 [Cryomyces minteri]|uniref:Pyridoxamine 5'-phosphate oxidase putative domain-containing protein n=1 Tax=Cryomyces minteri TaxID=331657 RepID=A0A4U0WPE2_9PEZI|nr:hypothetical protein B0A49_10082 [Cryomyces minteri]